MHRTVLILALALGGAVTGAPATQEGPGTGELTVRAAGFAHPRGHAVAKLFAPGDSVLKTGRWQLVAAIEDGAAVFRFAALPAGRYALVVFHDENDNTVVDHGLLGPSEPLGFSGGFAPSLLSGRPDFERLAFDFKPPALTLQLRVK